jgi:hypothetical protein
VHILKDVVPPPPGRVQAGQGQGVFREPGEVIESSGISNLHRLHGSSSANLGCLCDIKEAMDQKFVRLNDSKVDGRKSKGDFCGDEQIDRHMGGCIVK